MGTEHHIEPTDAHHRATEATGAMRTMRAIVQDAYGDTADVLRLEEIIRPEIADDEVLVRVRAAGVDRGVWHVMAHDLVALTELIESGAVTPVID
jgi:D-arabinose 1-dehydrogenase-like Zn-dependent alcohol dehydrogenase